MRIKTEVCEDTMPEETGKATDEFSIIDLFIDGKQIGQVELYLNDDKHMIGADTDEWVLKYRPDGSEEDNDWEIISQGNI